MRIHRSALVAGILALGVAACGDDVEIVQSAPEPPPPRSPVTASMVPASESVLMGNSVVFTLSASGGVAGDAATWTCASSNTGIATVSVVSAGCQATGVAAGSVTITATVTKSGEMVNVGAQLTVTEETAGEPAFLILKGVEGENMTDASRLKGRVEVHLGVEHGDQTLERLSLLVDGEMVAYQSLGNRAMAAPEDDAAAEQAVHDFTLAFDSDGYDAESGAPDYMNGDHTIAAELQIAGGMMADGMTGHETHSSNVMTVQFDNDDGYALTADLGDNSVLAADGRRWYGGPGNGEIGITALPVLYSGGSVESVTVEFCGDDPSTDAGAPYEFSFECDDRESATGGGTVGETPIVSSGGDPGTILNEDDLPFPAFVDFVAPTESPIIVANRNGREDGWLNAAVGLTGEFHGTRGPDNWLVKGADETGGVGGYNMMVRIGDDLEEALAAAPSARLPAESDDTEAYCAIASATDDLGNESGLPDEDDDCRIAPSGADALWNHDVATDADGESTPDVYGFSDATENLDDDDTNDVNVTDLSNQTLWFGVDTTAPVIRFGDHYDGDPRHSTVPGAFSFDHFDDESDIGNSGIDADDGLMVSIQRRNTSETRCLAIADDGDVSNDSSDDCDSTSISDEDVTLQETDDTDATPLGVAYYTLSGTAQDKGGNRSGTIRHTFVYDGGTGAAASATDPAIPGSIEAGEPFSGASFLNDNLSIRDYFWTADFADVVSIGVGTLVVVDAFNASSLTYRNHTVSATVDTYAAVQADAARGTIQRIDGVTVAVRDQAQDAYTRANTDIAATDVTDVPDADDAFVGTDVFTYAFVTPAATTTSAFLTIQVRATAVATGAFSDPFERVDFLVTDVNGASWKIAEDATGTSGRTDGRNRTWTYSATVPRTLLRAVSRSATGTAAIVAIAVNDNDVGLVGSTTIPTSGN